MTMCRCVGSAALAEGEQRVNGGEYLTDSTLMLAIDTSTEQTGMALYDGACLDDVSWSSCREHTVVLLDEIDHQLKRSKLTVSRTWSRGGCHRSGPVQCLAGRNEHRQRTCNESGYSDRWCSDS